MLGLVAIGAATAVAFGALGQSEAAPAPQEGLWAKVAANLGVSVDDLVAAFTKARMELIDEAIAAGEITPEEAEELKNRIEARQALRDVMEEAIASGKITPEQLQYLRGPRMPERARLLRGGGLRGRLMDGIWRGHNCP